MPTIDLMSIQIKNNHSKFIFVTGGVVSSLGKGITAASLASLMECRGLSVTLIKLDPYINIDPGTNRRPIRDDPRIPTHIH